MTQSCIRALLPWRDRDFLLRGTPLGNLPHRRSVITTDTLLMSWGAIWEGRTVSCMWEPPWSSEHRNLPELRAVHLALRVLLPFICYKRHVLVRKDSTSAVCRINHQCRTKSLQVVRELLTWAWPRLTFLRAVHIPGEWWLHPGVVTQIWT